MHVYMYIFIFSLAGFLQTFRNASTSQFLWPVAIHVCYETTLSVHGIAGEWDKWCGCRYRHGTAWRCACRGRVILILIIVVVVCGGGACMWVWVCLANGKL